MFLSVFCLVFSAATQSVKDIEGSYVRSSEHAFLCEDGEKVGVPFWIGQKDYQWVIKETTLKISFKAKIIGIKVSDVSIDYQLNPLKDNKFSATPSEAGAEEHGASSFIIEKKENGGLVAIRGNNPRYCNAGKSYLHMTAAHKK